MFEVILAIVIGILAGTITGLTPGIHTNLIAIIILAATSFLLPQVPILVLVLFIVSMSITHTFIDFIPSIYLGAPDEDTALSTLPGHEFLLKGKGHEAVLLTLLGSSIAIISLIIIVPLFILIIPKAFPIIEKMMSWFLIWISIFLIYADKNSKILPTIIFLTAGFLGIATLNLNLQQPLLPLLTGLFGSSTLLYSISKNISVPEQKIGKLLIIKKEIIKPFLATSIISPIASFLPGLGSSQAAIIGSKITGDLTKKQFLILIGSINTLIISTSFLTLFLINKTRTGTAAAISELLQLTPKTLTAIFITILVTAVISGFLTIRISKLFAKNIHKINYLKISKIIIILLTLTVFLVSGFLGILVFIISTVLGYLTILLSVRRGFLMGVLLVPTILFYLPWF